MYSLLSSFRNICKKETYIFSTDVRYWYYLVCIGSNAEMTLLYLYVHLPLYTEDVHISTSFWCYYVLGLLFWQYTYVSSLLGYQFVSYV